MKQKEIAAFTVKIFSTENSSWQGTVESNGESFCFDSELQLIKWLCKTHPELMPRL